MNFKRYNYLSVVLVIFSMLSISCEQNQIYKTTGYVEAQSFYLLSINGGYLTKLMVNAGQKVKKGQLLFQLHDESLKEKVEQARAQWKIAKLSYDEFKKNNASPKYKTNIAQQQMFAAQSNFKAAQWLYNSNSVSAPAQGSITTIYYHQDEYVPAMHPVMNLSNLQNEKIIFFVPEKNLNHIKIGKRVIVTANHTLQVKATIHYINNTAEFTPELNYSEFNRHNFVYKVEATLSQNKGVLHPGQPVEINYD